MTATSVATLIFVGSTFVIMVADTKNRRNRLNYLPHILAICQTFVSVVFQFSFLFHITHDNGDGLISFRICLCTNVLQNALLYVFLFFLIVRELLISSLLVFQARCPLNEMEIRKESYFKREKAIIVTCFIVITPYIVFQFFTACVALCNYKLYRKYFFYMDFDNL